jgi:NAD+ synthase (glutamine-hydrolysing)
VDQNGKLIFYTSAFEENLYVVDSVNPDHYDEPDEDDMEILANALTLGVKDYFAKTGFQKAVIGLSGGIDSALVATLAVKALGKENVVGILMPGPFSTEHSITDARQLAESLGIATHIISIKEGYNALLSTYKPLFAGKAFDVTEENLQARLRGTTLMAYSNKFNALVLNTGNKSEIACGYSTLYGDMVGALAVIGDIYKTEVYQLALYFNRGQEIIPVNTIKKAPSAELRPNQKDQDSLAPYEILDKILFSYIEENKTGEEISRLFNIERKVVDDTIHKIFNSEYKRRQAPIVLKVSHKAFGSGRRMPISGAFR